MITQIAGEIRCPRCKGNSLWEYSSTPTSKFMCCNYCNQAFTAMETVASIVKISAA